MMSAALKVLQVRSIASAVVAPTVAFMGVALHVFQLPVVEYPGTKMPFWNSGRSMAPPLATHPPALPPAPVVPVPAPPFPPMLLFAPALPPSPVVPAAPPDSGLIEPA